jgi:hypothetical protein
MESIPGFLGLQKPAISSHIHHPTQCGTIADTIFLTKIKCSVNPKREKSIPGNDTEEYFRYPPLIYKN